MTLSARAAWGSCGPPTQPPLCREVAVKGLREDKDNRTTTELLLREARVTGSLEHPNVVPIHALGKDERGRPLIVMKRIEGSSWYDLLCDKPAIGKNQPFSHLQRHLDILVDVAKAVHFAHSRGIVHRDLKPDNVMLGVFGEVYLVDWGIAARISDDVSIDLPSARDIDVISGTPGYMAPEMAAGDGATIGAHTDVYLLGAILHEVLTGSPPHEDETMMLMLTHAFASEPQEYSVDVPPELAAIANCAMAREPLDRYQSASAFAAALMLFLNHRGSVVLSQEATQRFVALRDTIAAATVATAGPNAPGRAATAAERRDLYNTFNQCRYGFVHALTIWDGNTAARENLQAAVELMIEYELAQGSAGAAAALLPDLPIAMPKLAKRVERKRSRESGTAAELQRMVREADPTTADGTRAGLALATALTWGPVVFAGGYLTREGIFAFDHLVVAVISLIFLAAAIIVGLARREELYGNASNLRAQLAIIVVYIAIAALWPIAGMLNISVPSTLALQALNACLMWLAAAVTVDRRLVAPGISHFAALIGTLLLPAYAFEWVGLAIFSGNGTLAIVRWRTTSADQARPLSQRWSKRRARRLLKKMQKRRAAQGAPESSPPSSTNDD